MVTAITPLGVEFQVNSYTTDNQFEPTIAALDDGGFVVTWTSDGQDGDSYGVYGQRYDANGVAVGPEFQINTFTTDIQRVPTITGLSDGGFLVTWTSVGDQDGSSSGIFGQRYNADGTVNGSEFQINTYTLNEQGRSVVTTLPDGSFVVAWFGFGATDGSGHGIYGRLYTSAGVAVADEFQINTSESNHQQDPAIRNKVFRISTSSFYDAAESNHASAIATSLNSKLLMSIPGKSAPSMMAAFLSQLESLSTAHLSNLASNPKSFGRRVISTPKAPNEGREKSDIL